MNFFLQLVVTGFALGMVYALIAIGFVIILKCSNAFNIAQGHFVLIGGYLGYTFLVPCPPAHVGRPASGDRGGCSPGPLHRACLPCAPWWVNSELAMIMMTIALATVLEGLGNPDLGRRI